MASWLRWSTTFSDLLPEGWANRLPTDRTIVGFGLAATIALAWVYTLAMADSSHRGSVGLWALPRFHPGDNFAALAIMWSVMMTAMMLPTAWPMILLTAGVQQQRGPGASALPPTALFGLGYLAVWTLFSLLAAALQLLLRSGGLLTGDMAAASPALAGGVLIGAGLFQWTPLKEACLRHCRSPVGFLATYWREGLVGSFGMGLRHGAFCVGCCWVLMLVLFVTGVMNVLWMVLLTGLTLFEKVTPLVFRPWLKHGSAAVLVVWGVWVLLDVF